MSGKDAVSSIAPEWRVPQGDDSLLFGFRVERESQVRKNGRVCRLRNREQENICFLLASIFLLILGLLTRALGLPCMRVGHLRTVD